nr:MmpS family transport accessory protein [Mycobacterium sp.]
MKQLVDDIEDYPDDENCDTDSFGYEELGWPADRRWRPAVAIIGAVMALGAVATAVIINSGDSATTKATVGAPTPTPHTVISTTSPRPTAPPSTTSPAPQLPRETVTTVIPTSPALTTPGTLPNAAPPPVAVPPRIAVNPRTVVYSVTGSKQLIDLVNVVYTDARGFPVTEFNVALPWTKVVVLNPGVQTQSVIASSIYSRLDCSIVNAQGQLVKTSTNNSAIATCTR